MLHHLLQDYNESVVNKEGLQLATEGANVSNEWRVQLVLIGVCNYETAFCVNIAIGLEVINRPGVVGAVL